MGRQSKQKFLQRHINGQQSHEKMLNITIYQRNANQNYNEVTPHTSENGYHQNGYKELMLKSVWRKENTVSGDVNWYSHYGKQWGRHLKKLKIEISNDPTIPILAIHPYKTLKKYMHPYIHSTTIHNCQDMEKICMSIDK